MASKFSSKCSVTKSVWVGCRPALGQRTAALQLFHTPALLPTTRVNWIHSLLSDSDPRGLPGAFIFATKVQFFPILNYAVSENVSQGSAHGFLLIFESHLSEVSKCLSVFCFCCFYRSRSWATQASDASRRSYSGFSGCEIMAM